MHVRRCVGDRWVTPNGLVGRFVGWSPKGAPVDAKKKGGEPLPNTWKVFCTGKEEGGEG
jgi:hypothetical protein